MLGYVQMQYAEQSTCVLFFFFRLVANFCPMYEYVYTYTLTPGYLTKKQINVCSSAGMLCSVFPFSHVAFLAMRTTMLKCGVTARFYTCVECSFVTLKNAAALFCRYTCTAANASSIYEEY